MLSTVKILLVAIEDYAALRCREIGSIKGVVTEVLDIPEVGACIIYETRHGKETIGKICQIDFCAIPKLVAAGVCSIVVIQDVPGPKERQS